MQDSILCWLTIYIPSFVSLMYSNASCTTNCLAPFVKILDEEFGKQTLIILTVSILRAGTTFQAQRHLLPFGLYFQEL